MELEQITYEIESVQHLPCQKHDDNNNKTPLFSYFGYLSKLDEGSSRRKENMGRRRRQGDVLSFHCLLCVRLYVGCGRILGTGFNSRISF